MNPIGEPVDAGVSVVHVGGAVPAREHAGTDHRHDLRDDPADLPGKDPAVRQRPARESRGSAPLG